MKAKSTPALLILNQMAGPMTWELAEDLGKALGSVGLLTGHPDTLQKKHPNVQMFAAMAYERGNFVRRTFTWLCYCWQAFWWVLRWPRMTPLLLFSNPPILVWLGWVLYKLRGQRYAVMVHDIYPDVLVRTNIFSERHLLVRFWRTLNRQAYEHAAVVMTLGEYMAATLARQFDPTKTPATKIEIIPPWVDTEKIKPIPKTDNWFAQQYNQVDKLTVMYSGNMGIGHDIETMLDAARLLRHRDDIHFMFIGAGPKWKLVDEAVKREHLSNITVLGWLSEEIIPFSLATADIAFVSLEAAFEGVMVPSKSSYSIAAGSALILLSSGQNELRAWTETLNLGIALSPGDVTSIVCKLTAWAEDKDYLASIRNNILPAVKHRFSRNASVSTLTDALCIQLCKTKTLTLISK